MNDSSAYRRNRRQAAFSLIEVIVATSILAAGVIGVVAGVSQSARADMDGQRRRRAADIAQRELILAVLVSADHLSPRTGSDDNYAWSITYEPVEEGLQRATVVVRWTTQGRAESFTLAQVFAPPTYSEDDVFVP